MNQKLCAAHPHIVHLREAFLTPHHLGIAMEFADGGDLLDFIDTFAAQVRCSRPEALPKRPSVGYSCEFDPSDSYPLRHGCPQCCTVLSVWRQRVGCIRSL